MRTGGPTRRQRAPRRAPDQATEGTPSFCMTRGVSWLAKRVSYSLGTRFSILGSEREPNGGEEFFVVKRFGQKGRSPRVQRGGANQWIVLSGKDDDACRRRDCAEPRLNLKAAHLRHTNVNQGNRGTMRLRITQELLGIAKRFCVQTS